MRDAPSGRPRFLRVCPLLALTPVFPPVLVPGARSSPPPAWEDLPSAKPHLSANSDLPPQRARSIGTGEGVQGASSGHTSRGPVVATVRGLLRPVGVQRLASCPSPQTLLPPQRGVSSACPETPTLVPAWPTPAAQTHKKAPFPAAPLEVSKCNSVF